MIEFLNMYGYYRFDGFQDVVDWLTGYVPFVLLTVFVLNVVFNIIYHFMHMGGK